MSYLENYFFFFLNQCEETKNKTGGSIWKKFSLKKKNLPTARAAKATSPPKCIFFMLDRPISLEYALGNYFLFKFVVTLLKQFQILFKLYKPALVNIGLLTKY